MVERFEYEITVHPAETFRKVVYFCSETGECSADQVPGDELQVLGDLLNDRGRVGWELVQMAFGKDSIMVFWKRRLIGNDA
ncbi:hypothetical protein AMJ39_05985 [candidate division TA06 bacterium DG_24]|jgi:hypothetical protein|uniref:DUF4177 domain-containing protein n=3 Tax=Bacteria division TA06 TaxID=1156500 RepID=A0A0S8JK86_UNCT6|nr:MAG: hypothetical protein AMJ39_05985 [candidate division TA06 bacterium DG_24]KPK70239.1 MAG: hypothetical protein AMJ82_03635 [candidate division TA06 bacterium SM23_40]KPL09968.1 MAG: hypothetical protein AMJ71_04960 [candidate division TA06 bacterium SM1_40]